MSSKLLRCVKAGIPWNMNAGLLRREVACMDSPVNNAKYFPQETYVGLFKEFAEAIAANDWEALSMVTEPKFARGFQEGLDEAHKVMAEEGLEVRVENNRKQTDETTIFLYNIENFFIVDSQSKQYRRPIDRHRLQSGRQSLAV